MHFSTTLAACLTLAAGTLVEAQYDSYGSGSAGGSAGGSYGGSYDAGAAAGGASASASASVSVSADAAVSGAASYDSSAASSTWSSSAAIASGTDIANNAAASPSAGMATMHVVKVSNKNADLVFTPNDIKAAKGDMIQFQFYPKNHSIVQSTFDKPCEPIADNMPGAKGFFSGFMPVSANASMMPVYTVEVKDDKPMWFYCSQGKHCQGGMVGVVNAPAANTSRTIDTYKSLAASAANNKTPKCEGESSSNSTLGVASSTGAAVAPSSGSDSTGFSTATVVPTPTSGNGAQGVSSASVEAVTGVNAAPSLKGMNVAGAGLVALVMGLLL
ncbi:MAG: hypothetical protein M1817_001121 [Caeruleum heppii]|nr:MAG: hypothetical protein M1817_001121 [Caeruleum heppii]